MLLDTRTQHTNFENWLPLTMEQTIAALDPISLAEIGDAALLNRVETKYVVSAETIPAFLAAINNDYHVLSIEGKRLNRYKTLYFDSAEFIFYRRHHAGASNRYKVRSREYVETGTAFLELKHKTNKKRTIKQRISTDAFLHIIDRPTGDFLRDSCPHNIDALYGRLFSHYKRITLVSRHSAERVTIDLELSFEWEGKRVSLDDIAIIEIKRAPRSAESLATKQLRHQHIRPSRFSKYCIGVTQLYPHIKHNNFKPTLRLIEKLSQGVTHDYQH